MPRHHFKPGQCAFPKHGTLPGADAFTRVVILATHPDGTVDVAILNGGKTWTAVPANGLTPTTV